MVNILGPSLPRFSTNEVNHLKNSKVDFMGINHYTSYFIRDCLVSACNTGSGAFKADGFALKLDRIGNITIGELVRTFVVSYIQCDYTTIHFNIFCFSNKTIYVCVFWHDRPT